MTKDHPNKPAPFEYVKLHPARWNLLDMINTVGRASIPATLFYDIDMTWAEQQRKILNESGRKVTITAFLIKAISIAQAKHPMSRTQMLPNGRLVQFNEIRAQFTVERFVDGTPALYFGDIREPATKRLAVISEELHAYGTEPIEKLPQLEIEHRFSKYPWLLRQIIIYFGIRIPSMRLRYMGATFGFSSLGKYGCRNMISPGVITSMFCVGEVEDRPMAINGKVEIRPQLSLVLNFDHRVIDGAAAARFMTDTIELLQGGMASHLQEELDSAALTDGATSGTRD
jgi:pyruvate/2-oxoglutarate dehydrogenase complex dihydrolipoamide acyltransferase (E2) component